MKISIITATYNQKDYLRQTIESVQASLFLPYKDIEWEHLIYDDASTDGTDLMLKQENWPHVTYIRGTENKGGPSYGKNLLVERATGDYIFMIDHDDILLQRTLHNFIRYARKEPDRAWFTGDFLRVDTELRYLPKEDYYTWEYKNTTEMLESIFRGEHFIQSNVFFKRSLFLEVGGFDTSRPIDQDLDLFIRFLLKGHLPLYCPFITHLHRFHPTNLSTGVTMDKHLTLVKELAQKYHQELEKLKIKI